MKTRSEVLELAKAVMGNTDDLPDKPTAFFIHESELIAFYHKARNDGLDSAINLCGIAACKDAKPSGDFEEGWEAGCDHCASIVRSLKRGGE